MGFLSRQVARRPPGWIIVAVASIALVAAAVGAAAAETAPAESVPSLEELLEQLRQLEARIDRTEQDSDAEIARLRERIRQLEEELRKAETQREEDELASILADAEAEEQRKLFVGRQRNLQTLNPEISFLGDVSYDWSDSEIKNGFLLRAVEVVFQAPLDPYTRFRGVLAAHQEPFTLDPPAEEPAVGTQEEEEHEHGHIDVGVEEAYMEWVALPLQSRLRVGRFRQQFGTLNRWHPHALSSVDIPFALRNLFGHDGLVGLGFGMDFRLPSLRSWGNGLTFEIVNADNPSAFAGSDFRDPTFLLRYNAFFDLGPNTYFDFGLNGVRGPNDAEGRLDTTVSSIDVNFVWEPVNRARYRGVEVRGEFLDSRFETADPDTVRSSSYYCYVSFKLSRRWIVGFRYDDAELPFPRAELYDEQEFREGLREKAWSPYATMWQSEFVRLRLQYQHVTRDFRWAHGPEEDDLVWVQVTFAAGPHKHEAY